LPSLTSRRPDSSGRFFCQLTFSKDFVKYLSVIHGAVINPAYDFAGLLQSKNVLPLPFLLQEMIREHNFIMAAGIAFLSRLQV
jgi:hypothetical protein